MFLLQVFVPLRGDVVEVCREAVRRVADTGVKSLELALFHTRRMEQRERTHRAGIE